MSFSATYIEIALRYQLLEQNCTTIRQYSWDGVAIGAASAAQVGEAWWNHYKAAWRALAVNAPSVGRFLSVVVREVGGTLTYGEYPVPVGEQLGTRTVAGGVQMAPSYAAVGVRLAVNTLVTRPGQMRVPFMTEADFAGNDVEPGFLTLVNTLADLYDSPQIMGAPIATGVLTPAVVRFGADNDTVLAGQPVVGHVTNPFVTSQVSRRKGHGN